MIAKEFCESLRPDIDGVSWVSRYGGLTTLVSKDEINIPMSEAADLSECYDGGHYKDILPNIDQTGVVYFEKYADSTYKKDGKDYNAYEKTIASKTLTCEYYGKNYNLSINYGFFNISF